MYQDAVWVYLINFFWAFVGASAWRRRRGNIASTRGRLKTDCRKIRFMTFCKRRTIICGWRHWTGWRNLTVCVLLFSIKAMRPASSIIVLSVCLKPKAEYLWAGTEESGVVGYHQGRFTSYGSEHGLYLHNMFWISGNADGNPIIFLSNLQVYRFWTVRF